MLGQENPSKKIATGASLLLQSPAEFNYLQSYFIMCRQHIFFCVAVVIKNQYLIKFFIKSNHRVGSAYSTSFDLKSGIVQRSCIVPLLFINYINDVADLFHGNKNVVYTPAMLRYSVIDSQDVCIILQLAIDELVASSVK